MDEHTKRRWARNRRRVLSQTGGRYLQGTVRLTYDDLDERLRAAFEAGRECERVGAPTPCWTYPVIRIDTSTDRRRCEHCGNLFVPQNRSDQVYCQRPAPGEGPDGRTCQQVGPQARYHTRLTGVRAVYRRDYKRLDNYVRRGWLGREDLDRWRVAARDLLAEAEREQWELGEFEERFAGLEPRRLHPADQLRTP